MGWKSRAIKPFARTISAKIRKDAANAVSDQQKIFQSIVKKSKQTAFGTDHDFASIKSFKDFSAQVPIVTYEQLQPYITRVVKGEANVLWPGKPSYLAKTSGTTSGVKYIPITKASLPNHMNTARNALLSFAYRKKRMSIFDGKLIFMSGSPVLQDKAGMKIGRLSGIVNHEIPKWALSNQIPTYETNCIEDWEPKLDVMAAEPIGTDLRLVSGIPPWVQMFYETLLKKTGKETIKELFPNFQIFAYGGVNFSPYKQSLKKLVGFDIPSFETYPASEGFIAFQDESNEDGLLLNTNSGIFFEFVPVSEINAEKPIRLTLKEIELNTEYVVILNNNAGLWGYNIGDTIQFVSKDPYRLVVSGRVKHYTSAFGEHVIAKEVETAFSIAAAKHQIQVTEFTVAPQVNPESHELPHHEWFMEFEQEPQDLHAFAHDIDAELRKQNIYYDDLIKGNILQPLVLRKLKKFSFQEYMKSIGKLGGQNKVPRLSNDRIIANKLSQYIIDEVEI